MGAEVVLIDPSPVPLHRVLGTEIGGLFSRLHAHHGVELRLGSGVRELRGRGSVQDVVLSDGRVEPASIVVAGIGVTPNVALAEAAGLATADGVVVDQLLEARGSGVYAAGDVASAYHPHYKTHLRVEHWSTALNQGGTAGRNAAGGREVYDRLPYFFSDQYDLGLEYVGHGHPDDSVIIRGDSAGLELIAFWLRHGRVSAAMNVNVWDVADDLKAIVASARRADPARLADVSIPLSELA
jgi:3-phenylpropionate/trans-cinnamate dioxygenase ferredoxin reductase subunit